VPVGYALVRVPVGYALVCVPVGYALVCVCVPVGYACGLDHLSALMTTKMPLRKWVYHSNFHLCVSH
jgi:hypothetical protein